MKVFVTPHARQRFRERFRMQFNPEIFKEGREIYMLRKLFAESKSCDFALRMRAGDYNALCVQEKCVVRYSKYKNIVIVWTVNDFEDQESNIAILTVMPEGCKVRSLTM